MPGRDYAKPWVESALKSGLGPTAGLRAARQGGLRITDSDWFRTFGSERNNRAIQAKAIDQPLNRRPTADQIGQWDTVNRKGFAYRVVGLLEDRETGALKTKVITATFDTLVSRGKAIQAAIDSFDDPDERYPSTLVAAFNVGVFEMVPLPGDDGEF